MKKTRRKTYLNKGFFNIHKKTFIQQERYEGTTVKDKNIIIHFAVEKDGNIKKLHLHES